MLKTCFLTALISICSLSASAASPPNGGLDSVVSDICNMRVVLLGEDSHHGSGRTLEVKVELVQRLIDECGFSGVFFESPVYEFLNFENSVSSGASSKEELAQSIGGLWSKAKPMESFMAYLYSKADQGKIRLAGIDSQFGANQPFSQRQLPTRLSGYLDEKRGGECEAELSRYLNWQYDEKSPYDELTRNRISACVSDIKDAVFKRNADDEDLPGDKLMIENFHRYLKFGEGDYFNLRDESMAENVIWHLSNLPEDSKVVVWCATIHAVRTLSPISPEKIPMGFHLKRDLDEQVVGIGFSALSGSFGRSTSKRQNIERTSLLEQEAFATPFDDIRYLDSERLRKMGAIEAQPIQYNSIEIANWSELLDGIVVLREEHPVVLSN